MAEKNTLKIDTPSSKYTYATGKRKTAVAKVRLYKGKGVITINNKKIEEYCNNKTDILKIRKPLQLTGTLKDYDITVLVRGGGTTAQAEASRHGIARALIVINPEFRTTLKQAGLLTRDPRKKERKKPGLKKARKKPQFSKR